MKKYVKPEIYIEKYEMTQQIASCDYDSNNTADDTSCRFTGINKDFGVEMTIFQGNCAEEGGVFAESYCYHGSSGGYYSIFNS